MEKLIRTLYRLSLGILLFVPGDLVLASNTPAFRLLPTTNTAMLLPANSSAIVQYQVTNQTLNTRTLTIQTITGISQTTSGLGDCSSPFTLAPQQSCLLTLQVNGSQIPARISGGPVVCKTQGLVTIIQTPFFVQSQKLAICYR